VSFSGSSAGSRSNSPTSRYAYLTNRAQPDLIPTATPAAPAASRVRSTTTSRDNSPSRYGGGGTKDRRPGGGTAARAGRVSVGVAQRKDHGSGASRVPLPGEDLDAVADALVRAVIKNT